MADDFTEPLRLSLRCADCGSDDAAFCGCFWLAIDANRVNLDEIDLGLDFACDLDELFVVPELEPALLEPFWLAIDFGLDFACGLDDLFVVPEPEPARPPRKSPRRR